MERRVHGPNRLTAIRSRIRMKTEYFSIIGSSYHFLYFCIIIVLKLLFEYEKSMSYFALMAFSLAALATGCTKEDEKNPKQNEIEINVVEVGDNSAVINCVNNPDKSEMYQLSLNETTYLNNKTKGGI